MPCKGCGTKAHRRIQWEQGLVSFTYINKSSRSPCDLDHEQIDLKINRDHLQPEINICAKFGDPCSILCQVIIRTRFGLPKVKFKLPCDLDLTKIDLKIDRVHLHPEMNVCAKFGDPSSILLSSGQGLVSQRSSSRSPCDLDLKWIDLKIDRDDLHTEMNVCAKFGDRSSIVCQVLIFDVPADRRTDRLTDLHEQSNIPPLC